MLSTTIIITYYGEQDINIYYCLVCLLGFHNKSIGSGTVSNVQIHVTNIVYCSSNFENANQFMCEKFLNHFCFKIVGGGGGLEMVT